MGTTNSEGFPLTPNALQPFGPNAPWATQPPRSSPSEGRFLSKLDSVGASLIYSTYLRGATALAVDAVGNAYVAGEADLGFPTTAGAF